jgi:hypothetical protein
MPAAPLVGRRRQGYACGMSIEQADKELNDMILGGKAMEAYERFYADDVSMQENSAPPTVGKDANRKREIEFFSSVEAWHDGACTASVVSGNVSMSEWMMDVTIKGMGRVRMEQAVVRRWKDGKIVSERFYHG